MVKLILLFLFLSINVKVFAANVGEDVNDPNVVEAFQVYWDAFERYEKKVMDDGKQKYLHSIEKLQSLQNEEMLALQSQQLEKLNQSIRKYQQQLEKHQDAYNQPFVMLNLSRVLFLKSQNLMVSNKSSATDSAEHALVMLADIEQNFPNFRNREDALYTKATILDYLQRKDDAFSTWKYLASIANESMYGAHALISMGDYYFKEEQPNLAAKNYSRALDIFLKLGVKRSSSENIKVKYRLLWALYRSANLKGAVQEGIDLLDPSIEIEGISRKKFIQEDAVLIIGDSLFEEDNLNWTKLTLSNNRLLNFKGAIAHRVVERYFASSLYRSAAEIASFAIEEASGDIFIPKILSMMATSYKKMGWVNRSIATMEQLALLLPLNSLWRSKYRLQVKELAEMEEKATLAAKVIAAWYYERGLTTGEVKSFKTAATYYEILEEFNQEEDSVNRWRLRIAHCYFFSDHLYEAAKIYRELKQKYKVEDGILQVASYQLVMTYEKIWRNLYSKISESNIEPQEDKEANDSLQSLEIAVEEFANKFNSESRAVDLLLVGASALRDQGYYTRASKFWQRALVSKPNISQRMLAIRGLVFASMKEGRSIDVINMVRKFLKLEDWKVMGNTLRYELAGVLSVATIEEGKRLNDEGELINAGNILVEIADDYPDLPNRARIYRDGAYLLALGGEWGKSESIAKKYLDSSIKEFRGDMTYLLARTYEHQIRFDLASQYYIQMGTDFSNHEKSNISLQRGEKLFAAENDYAGAGQAAELLGNRGKSRDRKIDDFKRSFEYYIESNDLSKAKNVAEKRLKLSTSISDQLSSRLMIANAKFAMGQEDQALVEYRRIADNANKSKLKLGQENWEKIYGESNFLLGIEALEKFEDFDIFERSGSMQKNLTIKNKYFAELTKYFQNAETTNHDEWATRSRYYLAESASKLAFDMRGIIKKSNGKFDRSKESEYLVNIDRLENISKKLHTENLLVQRKNPNLYSKNIWVKKSSVSLGNRGVIDEKQKQDDLLPTAVNYEIPSQWSL